MAFLSYDRISALGFCSVGRDVLISDKASLYGCQRIALGDHIRVDDFAIISAGEGGIELGSYVHIASHCTLVGAGRISMGNFAGLSSRVSIYSSSDDYSGLSLTNPTVPEIHKSLQVAPVILGDHVIVGSGSVILPGVTISEGAAIAALSLVIKDCRPFSIYGGVPARLIKERKRDLLERAHTLISQDSVEGTDPTTV